MTWNEFTLFWHQNDMNMFSVIMGLYITAVIVRRFKIETTQMEYRSKEATKK